MLRAWYRFYSLVFNTIPLTRSKTRSARPNDKCWTTQHVGWTNILSFGHRVWWPLNMLDDVGTCLMQYQTFDPTSSNISFVLMLDAWNFVRLAGLNNMLHACTRIRTKKTQCQCLSLGCTYNLMPSFWDLTTGNICHYFSQYLREALEFHSHHLVISWRVFGG